MRRARRVRLLWLLLLLVVLLTIHRRSSLEKSHAAVKGDRNRDLVVLAPISIAHSSPVVPILEGMLLAGFVLWTWVLRTSVSAVASPQSERAGASDRVRVGLRMARNLAKHDAASLQANGLSDVTFAFGILNVMLTAYACGRAPESLWIMYGLKCFLLIPVWWHLNMKIHRGHLFILDFCWVANVCGGFYMMLTCFEAVPARLRRPAFLTFSACGAGPIAWANLVLGKGVNFHSVRDLVSTFIHLSPVMVVFGIRAYPDVLERTWPSRFPSSLHLADVSLYEVYVHGALFYFLWLAAYSLWMFTVGLDCPRKGYATVFDQLYRKHSLGAKFYRMTGCRDIRSHLLIYLVLHCISCQCCLLFAAVCFCWTWTLHLGFVGLLIVVTVWHGATNYNYILTKRQVRNLDKLLEEGDEDEVSGD